MIRTLLDVSQMQIAAFESRGQDADANQARGIQANLRHLKRNPDAPEFGRRVRELRRRQRSLQHKLPHGIVGSTFNPYRSEPVGSTAA